MADSGQQYLLEVVFAGNAIIHMLTGKTISVAVCGHMLIEAELIIILVAKVYHIPLSTPDTDGPKQDTSSIDSEIDDEETQYTGQQ